MEFHAWHQDLREIARCVVTAPHTFHIVHADADGYVQRLEHIGRSPEHCTGRSGTSSPGTARSLDRLLWVRTNEGTSAFQLFRRDAARWVRPEQVAALDEVTTKVIVKLLIRHLPLRAMAWFRFGTAAQRRNIRGVPAWVQRHILRVYGLELSVGADIQGGLYIAHPVGCVLAASSIGANVTVVSVVTFGTRGDARWPVIGDNTFFGAGARVLGGVTIGRGARVGANAVVVGDVEPGQTVVGVPARPTG